MESEKITQSGNFQLTASKLVSLSKIEFKRFVLMTAAFLIFLNCFLFSLIMTVIPQMQSGQEADRTLYILCLVSATSLLIAGILFHYARLSALRLYSVIEPAKNTFSLDENSNRETTSNATLTNPEIAQDRLPRTAANFYKIVDQTKDSFLGTISQTFKPFKEVHSFFEKNPLVSVGMAACAGVFIASMLVPKRKIEKVMPVSEYIRKPHLEVEKPKENLIYSTITELTMMGLSYGIQTLIKEFIFNSDNTAVSNKSRTDATESSRHGQIIPFGSKQRAGAKR